ncbi:hypothetical protein [Lacticaseibacillus nasuensis]|nr:hypothetical protein [Lacticaseibacillus nasuensis]MCX2455912.1 hypothetical protein [Lacticaseibacillus nasuensis]
MDETIFFNPGDAIAKDYDYAAARKSAEVFKVHNAIDHGLVVAQDEHGQFVVFDPQEAAALTPEEAAKLPASKYTVLARL